MAEDQTSQQQGLLSQDLRSRLSSRKLWVAAAGVLGLGGAGDVAQLNDVQLAAVTVVVCCYVVVEGVIDAVAAWRGDRTADGRRRG